MKIREIGVFSVKTHLSEILDKVSHGSEIVITNRGKPIAQLIPYKSRVVFKNRKLLPGLQKFAIQQKRFSASYK